MAQIGMYRCPPRLGEPRICLVCTGSLPVNQATSAGMYQYGNQSRTCLSSYPFGTGKYWATAGTYRLRTRFLAPLDSGVRRHWKRKMRGAPPESFSDGAPGLSVSGLSSRGLRLRDDLDVLGIRPEGLGLTLDGEADTVAPTGLTVPDAGADRTLGNHRRWRTRRR